MIIKAANESEVIINYDACDNNEENVFHKLIWSPNFTNEEDKFEIIKLGF